MARFIHNGLPLQIMDIFMQRKNEGEVVEPATTPQTGTASIVSESGK
jgi:hypothetical protein